jgi:hypothetical protein
MVVASS